jgi:Cys-tRNA(Pro)/Cys-tRNA(Cys) deacylase
MAVRTHRKLQSQRKLEALGVDYELVEFDSSIRSAELVAKAAGEDAGAVFKTLVVVDSRPGSKPILAVVPSNSELDLKALAKCMNAKKLAMATHIEAERLTRLKVGGISVLALGDRGWPVLLDASAETRASILVSAGERGYDLRLSPADFVRVTGAQYAALTA